MAASAEHTQPGCLTATLRMRSLGGRAKYRESAVPRLIIDRALTLKGNYFQIAKNRGSAHRQPVPDGSLNRGGNEEFFQNAFRYPCQAQSTADHATAKDRSKHHQERLPDQGHAKLPPGSVGLAPARRLASKPGAPRTTRLHHAAGRNHLSAQCGSGRASRKDPWRCTQRRKPESAKQGGSHTAPSLTRHSRGQAITSTSSGLRMSTTACGAMPIR